MALTVPRLEGLGLISRAVAHVVGRFSQSRSGAGPLVVDLAYEL